MIWMSGVNWIANNIRLASEHFSRSPTFHANTEHWFTEGHKTCTIWQPKKDFQTLTPVLVAVCVSFFVCVRFVLTPDSIWWKNTFFSRLKHFSLPLNCPKWKWADLWAIHHSSNPTAPVPHCGSAWLLPAIFPATCCCLVVRGCSNYWEWPWSL